MVLMNHGCVEAWSAATCINSVHLATDIRFIDHVIFIYI